MAYRRTTRRRTTGRRTTRRRKKSGGHRFLFLLLLIGVVVLAAHVFEPSSPSPSDQQAPAKGSSQSIVDSIFKPGKETASEKSKKTETASSESLTDKVKSLTKKITGSNETDSTAEKASTSSSSSSSETAAVAETSGSSQATASAPSGSKGKIAVCIDDGGRDLDSERVYEQIDAPLTLAVMPNQSHTREAASEWKAAGRPVIIHQPMETVSGSGMEPIVILSSMSDSEIRSILRDSISQIPEASGMNNHQGSKSTTDRRVMNIVMSELASNSMWFLDSATNTTTEADSAAAAYGVPYARNSLFVDNSTDVDTICQMIRKGANMADKNGSVIIIGHCRPNTARAFHYMIPKLQAEGYQFVYVSSLLH